MAVTGTIGSESVTLENAATESTLRELLKSSKDMGSVIREMAVKMGVQFEELQEETEDLTAATEEARKAREEETEAVEKNTQRINILNNTFQFLEKTMGDLMAGTATASDMFGSLREVLPPGLISELTKRFQQLSKIQEDNFTAYQKTTTAGVNFGGSLTDLRQAAADSYLTLDQFSNIVVKNAEVLAKMGGSASDGTAAFVRMSNELNRGDSGKYLQALGYTTEEVNQGMLNYIDMIGGLSSEQLKNQNVTKKVADGSVYYLETLNGLAEITGQTRDAQQAALKEQASNAAFQAKLQTMSAEDQLKANAAMANAMALGGKGGADALMSQILGMPPISEEAKIFTATMGQTAGAVSALGENVLDSSRKVEEQDAILLEGFKSHKNDVDTLGQDTISALTLQKGAMGSAFQEMQKRQNIFSQGSEADYIAILDRNAKKAALEQSQAEALADMNQGFKAFGAALWGAINPLIEFATGIFNMIGAFNRGVANLTEWAGPFSTALVVLGLAVSTATAAIAAGAGKDLVSQGISRVRDMLPGGRSRDDDEPDRDNPRQRRQGPRRGAGSAGGIADNLTDVDNDPRTRGTGGGLKGLATGLKAFANPATIAGAAGLAASIAIVGAGIGGAILLIGGAIAGATFLVSKALPELAEGLNSFADIDGENLVQVGLGITALGAGLAVMGAGTVAASAGSVISGLTDAFGGLIGAKSPLERINEYAKLGPGLAEAASGMQGFTNAVNQLISADFERLKVGAQALEMIKKNAPSKATAERLEPILSAMNSNQNTEPQRDQTGTRPADGPITAATDALLEEMKKLVETSMKTLEEMKSSVAYQQRQLTAISKLDGNLFT